MLESVDRFLLLGLAVEPRERERLLRLSNVGVAIARNLSLRDGGVAGDGLLPVAGVPDPEPPLRRRGDVGGLKSKSMKMLFQI